MAGRDLLPPLYGIVYEYLTLSEQWYVTTGALGAEGTTGAEGAEGTTAGTALDQFRAPKGGQYSTELEALKDAIVNDHFHIFQHARARMDPRETHLNATIHTIVKHDRIDMLKQYPDHLSELTCSVTGVVSFYGAIRIMQYAHQNGIKNFHNFACQAALGGHLKCLQAIAEHEPEYSGDNSNLYRGAVKSDNVEVVQFVEKQWPKALINIIPSIYEPMFVTRIVHSPCAYARSVKMAQHLVDRWWMRNERDTQAEVVVALCWAAITQDSLAMFIIAWENGGGLTLIGISQLCDKAVKKGTLKKTGALYGRLKTMGIFA